MQTNESKTDSKAIRKYTPEELKNEFNYLRAKQITGTMLSRGLETDSKAIRKYTPEELKNEFNYLRAKQITGTMLSRGLETDGIKTTVGKTKWVATTLRKILRNEKYIGDALLQKTVTTDFLTKKRVEKKWLVPQYYIENNHEPIIPRDLFLRVQEEMARRACLETNVLRRRQYSDKHCLLCSLR